MQTHHEVGGDRCCRDDAITVRARVRVEALEGDLDCASAVAGGVHHSQRATVHGQQYGQRVHELGREVGDVQFAVFLVWEEDDREWSVLHVVAQDRVERLHDHGHAGLVVGAQDRVTTAGDERLAQVLFQILGTDHCPVQLMILIYSIRCRKIV